MGTITLTLSASVGTVTSGQSLPTSGWTAGFDHAALVTAGRSRADGFDLRIEYMTTRVGMVSISGANTSNCRIRINSPVTMVAGVDAAIQMTLTFGNLGRATTPFTASAGTATSATFSISPGTPSALTLPSPGFPVNRLDVHDNEELAFPEWRVSHRSRMNENPRKRYGLKWANITPEDYYEIRAVVTSVRGVGVLTTYPAVLASAYGYRIVPLSFRCQQTSAVGFGSELELEEVYSS